MEAKVLLQKLKQAFNEIMTPAAADAPVAPVEYSLADGSKVMIDKLEVGGKVTLADGTPATEGEITLADGTVVSVDATGTITAVILPAAAPEAAPAMPEDMSEKFAAIEKLVTEGFAAQEQKFAAQEQKISEQEIKLSKANTVIEGLLNLTTLLVEAPTAEPDGNAAKTAFSKDAKKENVLMVERFRAIAENFNK
jgi:hypothetical protein